jgi:uncharacterized protein involved in outer membrane biogenesis
MRWKWIFGSAIILVIALMVAAYAVLATYDYTKLKPQIERMVKDATGRELTLRGDLDFIIGYPPVLFATDVVFANAPWGSKPQMITVDRLRVEMRLLPLLVREVVLHYLGLSGVEVLLETDPNGKGNWVFLGDRPGKKVATRKPLGIDIGRISVENLHLIYHRGKTGLAAHYTIDRLDVAPEEAAERLAIGLQARYNEQPVVVSGQTGVIRDLGSPERFPVELSGMFAKAKFDITGAVEDILGLKGIMLKVHVSGTDLADLGFNKTIRLPQTKAFDVTALLKGSKESLALEDVDGHLSGSGVELAFSGRVGNATASSDFDLQLSGTGQDLSTMGPIIGRTLPVTDQFAFSGHLRDATESLSFEDAKASANLGSLSVVLSGRVEDVRNVSGLDLHVEGSGKNLAEMTPIIGINLPATENFAVAGRLRGSARMPSLDAAQGHAQQGRLNLKLNGQIRNLLAFSGVDLSVNGWGADLAQMGKIFDIALPATDAFKVEGRLTGSTESLSFKEAHASARRGALHLKLNGGVDGVLAETTIELNLNASGTELAEIGPLIAAELPELGPFAMTAHLSGSSKAVSVSEFSATVDNSDLNGQATLAFRERPRITARLESSVIDFTRLMKNFEQDEKKPADRNSQQRRLFSDTALPIDVLKKVDADILIKARHIHARDARLEFGHLTLKLDNGDFSIERLEAAYKKTNISGSLDISDGAPPQVAFNFLVQGFNLGAFLKETGRSDTVEAIVDIAAYGRSRGNSVDQLMAHLNGAIGAVMGKGYLSRYLNMLSLNLSQKVLTFWDWARRHREKADQINCAVVQFDIKEGVATSKAFVFDSQLAVLTGEGEINLGTEQIDFLLVPDAKDPSLFNLSTNLRVRGAIMDPQVRPDTRSLLTQGSWALSSLAIGPVGLLAPFMHLGALKAHPCDVPGVGSIEQRTRSESGNLPP